VAVLSARDADFGETPLAVIYSDDGKVSVPVVIEHCNQRLSNFKVPRYVVIEAAPLPRLPSGKLSKQALRQTYKDAADYLPRVR
ncbi:MAG: hypothetical protein JNL55_05930, partial [Steroidobacter sp.]|nr:hypothetical protein [Steroidobacter sp.]